MRGEAMKHARGGDAVSIPPREGRVARPKGRAGWGDATQDAKRRQIVVVDTPPPRFQRARLP
jgi:hypothetical protein